MRCHLIRTLANVFFERRLKAGFQIKIESSPYYLIVSPITCRQNSYSLYYGNINRFWFKKACLFCYCYYRVLIVDG